MKEHTIPENIKIEQPTPRYILVKLLILRGKKSFQHLSKKSK